tara:strand:- start:98 stop:862 length:765 start_codon:yes stop_codon:yes gene_type:complete
MIKKFKKFILNNTGLLIRLDDIAENMNWKMMEQATKLFDKFNIKPVLGIIPNNKDPELLSYPKTNLNFWDQVKLWQSKGWEIAMHGNNHVYHKINSKNDYLSHGGNTEFCGQELSVQVKKISEGLDKFKQQNINVRTFFAPNHTFDQNTLFALEKCGIKNIIDGYGIMPYEENKMNFIPQLFYRNIALPYGIQSTQIHLNNFNQESFINFEKFIEKNKKKIITYDQALSKINNKFYYKIIRMISKKILQIKRLV